METKFTKGEWKLGYLEISSEYSSDRGDITTIDQCYCGFNVANTKKEAEANAKLIASAPCLLEALQYIINDIKPEDACRGKFESFEKSKAYVGSKRLPTDEAILRCIEAIKKATE